MALAVGMGRQGTAPLGSTGPQNMGQEGITPLVLHPPRGVTPMAGAAGLRGEAEEMSRAGSLHAAPPALQNTDAGKWGTWRDPRRRDEMLRGPVLLQGRGPQDGSTHRGTESAHEEMGSWETTGPPGRAVSGKRQPGERAGIKRHRNGVRGKRLLSE